MERNILFSHELLTRVNIEVTRVGSGEDPVFEVHIAYYKPAKPEPRLRERRLVFSSESGKAAEGFAEGFLKGHREGRSA